MTQGTMLSFCCHARVVASLRDGQLIGSCAVCHANLIRMGPPESEEVTEHAQAASRPLRAVSA